MDSYSAQRSFDVQTFVKNCIKNMEQRFLLTNNVKIRALQLETDVDHQRRMLRLIDHRPLVQQVWNEAVDEELNRSYMQFVRSQFSHEQKAVLFNGHKTTIDMTFNKYVLSNKDLVVQPHPIRSLLDFIPSLLKYNCFDLSFYKFGSYGLNVMLVAFYLSKNFLQEESSMTNDCGSICLNGVPGSGKSKLVDILCHFMNGFVLQDLGKGIIEFQNHDIVTKSFIQIEEINLLHLSRPEWKMLADLEVGIKCRVKNQQDAEIGKFVPVIATSNSNIYEQVILKSFSDVDMSAAYRRWGFVRFYEKWSQCHSELFNDMGCLYEVYDQVYSSKAFKYQMMNSLVAIALLFDCNNIVCVDYIFNYYIHCLRSFSATLFGQVCLSQIDAFKSIIQKTQKIYQQLNDNKCVYLQSEMNNQFEILVMQYLQKNYHDGYQVALQFPQMPFYIRCFCVQQTINMAIYNRSSLVLDAFIDKMQHKPLFVKIRNGMQEFYLQCKETQVLLERRDSESFNNHGIMDNSLSIIDHRSQLNHSFNLFDQ